MSKLDIQPKSVAITTAIVKTTIHADHSISVFPRRQLQYPARIFRI